MKGWKISTHIDDAKLKPGEYRLDEKPKEKAPVSFGEGTSARLRAQVLDRNGFTCQMCGLTPGEIDPETGRKVHLQVGHIKDKSLGGKDELSNLRALCSRCNEGAKNVTGEKPSTIWLLSQVRRAGVDEQSAIFDWLRKKFEG
jgi:5-methylcytosine-specific restriction endonuclease McrA